MHIQQNQCHSKDQMFIKILLGKTLILLNLAWETFSQTKTKSHSEILHVKLKFNKLKKWQKERYSNDFVHCLNMYFIDFNQDFVSVVLYASNRDLLKSFFSIFEQIHSYLFIRIYFHLPRSFQDKPRFYKEWKTLISFKSLTSLAKSFVLYVWLSF